ncbi:MAG: hypothetical protein LBP58_03140 [Azoarcus sp.]|jgi:hypothetical protein|nr:hypothetical protein [Azoarcus sp.]
MKIKHVIFLSRHPMTREQISGLQAARSLPDGRVVAAAPPPAVECRNVTFPASGEDAARQIAALAIAEPDTLVCGVFPAHVAAQIALKLAARRATFHAAPCVGIPVAVPAPAVEGENRGGGFVHDHWEWI